MIVLAVENYENMYGLGFWNYKFVSGVFTAVEP